MKKKSFLHRGSVRVRVIVRAWRVFWRELDAQTAEYHKERTQHPEVFFERFD